MKSAYLDGELCAVRDDGVPVFSRLQAAMDEGRTNHLILFAFDLLHLNGKDTSKQPLIERKELSPNARSARVNRRRSPLRRR